MPLRRSSHHMRSSGPRAKDRRWHRSVRPQGSRVPQRKRSRFRRGGLGRARSATEFDQEDVHHLRSPMDLPSLLPKHKYMRTIFMGRAGPSSVPSAGIELTTSGSPPHPPTGATCVPPRSGDSGVASFYNPKGSIPSDVVVNTASRPGGICHCPHHRQGETFGWLAHRASAPKGARR